MTDLTVRTYHYYGRVRAMVIFNGEDCYSEGETAGDALINLGIYLRDKERMIEDSVAPIPTLLRLMADSNHEIRDHRSNQKVPNNRGLDSKDPS